MKKTQFNQALLACKVLSIAFGITILFSSLVSFTIRSLGDDFLKQLGLSKPGAEEKIRHGFLSGSFDTYGIKNIKSIAAGSRVALANEILTYSKKYVSSPDFKKNYEEMRNYHKPTFNKIQTPAEMPVKEPVHRHEAAGLPFHSECCHAGHARGGVFPAHNDRCWLRTSS